MKKLLMQAIEFIGLSGLGWILDFCTYIGLGFLFQNLVLNNTISSCVGVTFVFTFASKKIFLNKGKIPLMCKYLLYILYQCILIFFVSKLLESINWIIIDKINMEFIFKFSSIISKILVTPVTMILNFVVMKEIIEKL